MEVSAPPAMLTDVGAIAQVTGLVGEDSEVVTAQVSPTLPVNPLVGFTVIVEVFPLVAPAVSVTSPLLLIVNPGVVLVAPVRIAVKPRV